MIYKSKLLIGLLLIGMACSNEKETPSGIKLSVLRKGDGVKLDSGTYLVLNMMFKDGKDSVWNDTRKVGLPTIMQMKTFVPTGDGVLEAIMMMSKGDSITFQVPTKTLFEKTFHARIPATLDSTSSFTFNIGLMDVLNAEQFQKHQDSMRLKQNEIYAKQERIQLNLDIEAIDKFLDEKGITAEETESGLRYVVTKAGKGENAQPGQSAAINYSGSLLNGQFFDSSIESVARKNNVFTEGRNYVPYDVVVDAGSVIKGWDEVMKLMNKGSKLTVYIPSPLAFGNQRRSNEIPENSILVFDMEMVEIK
ncbi:MAG: FKBP-type peptidyl-prolyl cis-trans isomerase [Bacteroidota bacterium]